MYKAEPILHKGQKRIAVYFERKPELIARFKKLKGAQWSATLKVWHLPDIITYRKQFGLEEKEPVYITNITDSDTQQRLKAVADKIKLKGFSPQTGKNYGNHLKEYIAAISLKHNPDKVTKDTIKNIYCGGSKQRKPARAI